MAVWSKALVFTFFPHIGGFAGSFITRANIPNWYEHLNKPSWRPKNWMFGPVWLSLYTAMGYASYLVYRDGGGFEGEAARPLALYGTQLALNWAWTPIFFGAHKKGLALAEIIGLWGCVAACAYEFHPINTTASYLMLPYLAWVSLATALTYTIWRDNPNDIVKEE